MQMPRPELNLPAPVLDLVLRDHELVAALPIAVRTIRRFNEAPLLAMLKRMVASQTSVAQVERVLTQHYEDARLEALETRQEPPTTHILSEIGMEDQTAIVNDVLLFGAEHGSTQIVEWALLHTSRSVPVHEALRAAANNGHFATVQLLYPRVTAFKGEFFRVSRQRLQTLST